MVDTKIQNNIPAPSVQRSRLMHTTTCDRLRPFLHCHGRHHLCCQLFTLPLRDSSNLEAAHRTTESWRLPLNLCVTNVVVWASIHWATPCMAEYTCVTPSISEPCKTKHRNKLDKEITDYYLYYKVVLIQALYILYFVSHLLLCCRMIYFDRDYAQQIWERWKYWSSNLFSCCNVLIFDFKNIQCSRIWFDSRLAEQNGKLC